MKNKHYNYLYGPVSSWRLGSSLGVDPISTAKKVCTFNCLYCQLGPDIVFSDVRKEFIQTKDLIKEIKSFPPVAIDYITFSGKGEPTLAKNLGEMITQVKNIRKEKIAIITNASLIDRKDVASDLSLADFVMLKLDAPNEEIFRKISNPVRGIAFSNVFKGIKSFRSGYKGKIALQIMFMEENKVYAKELARIALEINPDEVQINTPLRPSDVKPLSKEELGDIKKCFSGVKNISYVYEAERKIVQPVSEGDTSKRREG